LFDSPTILAVKTVAILPKIFDTPSFKNKKMPDFYYSRLEKKSL